MAGEEGTAISDMSRGIIALLAERRDDKGSYAVNGNRLVFQIS
jgi:hypothetical protein